MKLPRERRVRRKVAGVCDICDLHKNNLAKHMEAHRPATFECAVCDFKGKNQASLGKDEPFLQSKWKCFLVHIKWIGESLRKNRKDRKQYLVDHIAEDYWAFIFYITILVRETFLSFISHTNLSLKLRTLKRYFVESRRTALRQPSRPRNAQVRMPGWKMFEKIRSTFPLTKALSGEPHYDAARNDTHLRPMRQVRFSCFVEDKNYM